MGVGDRSEGGHDCRGLVRLHTSAGAHVSVVMEKGCSPCPLPSEGCMPGPSPAPSPTGPTHPAANVAGVCEAAGVNVSSRDHLPGVLSAKHLDGDLHVCGVGIANLVVGIVPARQGTVEMQTFRRSVSGKEWQVPAHSACLCLQVTIQAGKPADSGGGCCMQEGSAMHISSHTLLPSTHKGITIDS